ncbi:hypothetical protein D2Q93_04705 [Alicyclobacillaceae bacterium I2511]|nr:hypothetical protein D2Q93_04705 [Alicyclobacillaceae bacterium I2511]
MSSFISSPITDLKTVEWLMSQWVEQEFFAGPFFVSLTEGRYSMQQIRHFAIQYSYYSRHFPRVLGAAIAAMEPMGTWWVPLADNLWDEAGRGVSGKSHEELYRTFLRSVDPKIQLDKYGIPQESMSVAVEKAIHMFIAFFREATPLEAMAAVGFGSEFFAGNVMGRIAQGFAHPQFNQDWNLDLTFWTAHANEHEPRHYQLCKDILQQYPNTGDLETMLNVGRRIASSEALMYTELHEEMLLL